MSQKIYSRPPHCAACGVADKLREGGGTNGLTYICDNCRQWTWSPEAMPEQRRYADGLVWTGSEIVAEDGSRYRCRNDVPKEKILRTVHGVLKPRRSNVTPTVLGREEMLTRLLAINDEPHLVENFYPLLLKGADGKKNPMAIVLMITLAIHDYTKGLPAQMGDMIAMNIPDYIDALIPDPDVAQEAKDLYKAT